jgi:mutator protein MutT
VSDGEELPEFSVQAGQRRMTPIVVTAAVIERGGCFLVTRRQAGVHLAGAWEFPGGKCLPGEPLDVCMARELFEELAVTASVGREIFVTTHAYPERSVELHFLRCEISGEPTPQQGQAMRWVPRGELAVLEFPPADAELIRKLSAG